MRFDLPPPRKSDLDCQTESTHNTLSQRLKSRNEYTPKYRSRGASYRQITCQDSRTLLCALLLWSDLSRPEQRRTHHGAVVAEKETAHEDRSPLRAAEVSRTSSRGPQPGGCPVAGFRFPSAPAKAEGQTNELLRPRAARIVSASRLHEPERRHHLSPGPHVRHGNRFSRQGTDQVK